MTFYEHKQLTWQGRESLTENRRYTVKWQLRSNDADDGPQQAIAYFAATPGLPDPLQSYAIGNDVYTDLFLTSLDPVLQVNLCSEFDFVWHVTGVYEPIDDQESSEKEDGTPTSNPLEFRRRFDISFSHQTTDALNGRYVATWDGLDNTANFADMPFGGADPNFPGAYTRAFNTVGAIENTGGTAFDPPYQKTDSDIVLRIGYNSAQYDTSWWQFRNSVNKAGVRLNDTFFGITNWDFPKYTLRVEAIDSVFRFTNGVRYWETVFEFHYRSLFQLGASVEESGWTDLIPDMGFTPPARQGDEDGEGGKVPAIPPGAAAHRNVKDALGNNINAPIPFNGAGQPETGNAKYWIQYLMYAEQDFTTLPVGFVLIP